MQVIADGTKGLTFRHKQTGVDMVVDMSVKSSLGTERLEICDALYLQAILIILDTEKAPQRLEKCPELE